MFGLMQLPLCVLILVSCFALMMAQLQQQQQQPGLSYHSSWLYSMPWRPLILPPVARFPSLPGASQLSPGYTGPQTFPPVPQDQQQQQQQQQQLQNPLQQQQQPNPYQQQQQPNPYQQQQQLQQYSPQPYQQPLLLGLFTPQLQVHPLAAPPPQAGHFSLPFRPSPFAGYTEDEEEEDQVVPPSHQEQQQQHQQQLEEPPFHAHPYKPVAEGSELPRSAAGAGGGVGAGAGGAPLGYVYLSPSNLYNLVRS